MFSEKFIEALRCDSGENIVVNLYRNAYAVASADAEAARQRHFVIESVVCYGFAEKLNYLLRPLEVTR